MNNPLVFHLQALSTLEAAMGVKVTQSALDGIQAGLPSLIVGKPFPAVELR
ncbi:hypothetical protein FACS189441_8260 [Betaproteobacteria bacterium]|nr:hypothetical protein FACS189441_8260 [Betaproteobacteria bacterium]